MAKKRYQQLSRKASREEAATRDEKKKQRATAKKVAADEALAYAMDEGRVKIMFAKDMSERQRARYALEKTEARPNTRMRYYPKGEQANA